MVKLANDNINLKLELLLKIKMNPMNAKKNVQPIMHLMP